MVKNDELIHCLSLLLALTNSRKNSLGQCLPEAIYCKVFNLGVVIVPVTSHHRPMPYERCLSCFCSLSSASCPSQ